MRHEAGILAIKHNNFIRLSDREIECLVALQKAPLYVERCRELLRQGDTGHGASILEAGRG